jgi:hypothetical protein
MRAYIGRLAHPAPGFDVNHAAQSSDTDKAFFVPPTEVSFGPFRLLPTQFLLLEGDELQTSTGGLGSPPAAPWWRVAAALDSILTAFALVPAFV